MKILFNRYDGGADSGVTGYWLIEWKRVFSIVLLRFGPSTREVLHSHAFHALTWWLRGEAREHHADGRVLTWRPSLRPKWTPRSVCHRIEPLRETWALSFRGPWRRTWTEWSPARRVLTTLGHGRRVLDESPAGR